MAITFDPAKRDWTLRERGLDFRVAEEVFSDLQLSFEDDRFPYGETRMVTVGMLDARMVIVVWTARGEDRHVISMRKANAREQTRYAPLLRPPLGRN
jgi:uncharacterized DUF497 family protein